MADIVRLYESGFSGMYEEKLSESMPYGIDTCLVGGTEESFFFTFLSQNTPCRMPKVVHFHKEM